MADFPFKPSEIYDATEERDSLAPRDADEFDKLMNAIADYINNKLARGPGQEALLTDGSNSMNSGLDMSENDLEEIADLVGNNTNWRYRYENGNVLIQENTGTSSSPNWENRLTVDFDNFLVASQNFDSTKSKVLELEGKNGSGDPAWRMKFDTNNNEWLLQENTGTASSPTWTTRMTYDFDNLDFLSDKINSNEGDFQNSGSGIIKGDVIRLDDLEGYDDSNNRDWRLHYDENNNHVEFQENTGTNDSPVWEDRFAFELDSAPQVLLKDNTGIVFPDGSQYIRTILIQVAE